MTTHFPLASPELLCDAVREVTGRDLHATNNEGLATAAEIVKKLLNNADAAHELLTYISTSYRPAHPQAAFAVSQYRNVELLTAAALNIKNDRLQDDYPSESVAEEKASVSPPVRPAAVTIRAQAMSEK